MPSSREQTIISAKGLMTIPEPYRNYYDLKEGDGLKVMWDRFIVVIPTKIAETVTPVEEDLMNALLSKTGPDSLVLILWKQISEDRKKQICQILGLTPVPQEV